MPGVVLGDIMRNWGFAIVVAGAGMAGGDARALEMRITGSIVHLVGEINNGDQYAFKDLLNSPAGKGARIVNVRSRGGFIQPAGEIAREIRKRGLVTVFNASSGLCSSACTIIFAGGVQRHYVNGQGVRDGNVAPGEARGLAFHEASSALSRQPGRYSGTGTAEVIGYYYEFGVSSASSLITRAAPNRLYQVSGSTALSMGIVTSLAQP